MPIDALRTPDERFANLPGWSFAPHYRDDLPGYEGLRLHYVDEGPANGDVVLCLHGQPSWSYLYRKMIPVFVEAGLRVIAPDLFGFGRSDKPREDAVYTFDFHRNTLLAFVDTLGLEQVTLVCQDWGGILGLTLPVSRPQLVSRLLVMNTAIAVGMKPGRGFEEWLAYSNKNPDLDVAKLMARAIPGIEDGVAEAYAAPFPSVDYKAGVRRFPNLVPIAPDMDGAQWGMQAASFWSTQWSGPSFMAVGMQDPVLGPKVMNVLRQMIKGCPEPLLLEDAGHFVQERGEVIARAFLASQRVGQSKS